MYMLFTGHKTKGFSLVEALVAIAVLLIAVVGPLTIAAKGIQVSGFSKEETTAFFLAQEGIELVVASRDDWGLDRVANPSTAPGFGDWVTSLFGSGGCGPADTACDLGIDWQGTIENCSLLVASNCNLYQNTIAGYSGTQFYDHDSSGTPTEYNRLITVTKQGVDALAVQSTVRWNSALFGGSKTASFETVIFDIYEQ